LDKGLKHAARVSPGTDKDRVIPPRKTVNRKSLF
jgi:hypothetical protein